MSGASLTEEVLAAVAAERARQNARWGASSHPDVLVDEVVCARGVERVYGVPDEATARACCGRAFQSGRGTWFRIHLEEFSEALRAAGAAALAKGPDDQSLALLRLEEELIQLAATLVAHVEDLRQRRSR